MKQWISMEVEPKKPKSIRHMVLGDEDPSLIKMRSRRL